MPGFKYICSCPDSSKKRTFSLTSTSASSSFNKDWSGTTAGAKNGRCKHIWATMLARKEIRKEDIPSDIPIPIYEAEESQSVETYQPGYGGNSFSSGETFSVPSFRSYRGG